MNQDGSNKPAAAVTSRGDLNQGVRDQLGVVDEPGRVPAYHARDGMNQGCSGKPGAAKNRITVISRGGICIWGAHNGMGGGSK